jgi:hypothetical protein
MKILAHLEAGGAGLYNQQSNLGFLFSLLVLEALRIVAKPDLARSPCQKKLGYSH